MIKNILSNTATEFSKNYRLILNNFYPKDENNSNGFEERNLTNNFVFALMKCLEDNEAHSWFEVSWGKREKLDSIVFSPKLNSVFLSKLKE